MKAGGLTGFFLKRGQHINRISLERRDVRVRIEGVNATCRVPGGTGRQNAAFKYCNICPAIFCEMIGDRSADNASADDCNSVLCFHPVLPNNVATASSSSQPGVHITSVPQDLNLLASTMVLILLVRYYVYTLSV